MNLSGIDSNSHFITISKAGANPGEYLPVYKSENKKKLGSKNAIEYSRVMSNTDTLAGG